MIAKIKNWLASNATGKRIEHYIVLFAAAFGLTAIATVEKAAGAHGFQLSWSFIAGVAVAGAKAGYDAVRPALIAVLSKFAA